MGRGDKKTKKGKRWKGSYGNSRSRRAIKARLARTSSGRKEVSAEPKAEKPKARKTVRKKTETTES